MRLSVNIDPKIEAGPSRRAVQIYIRCERRGGEKTPKEPYRRVYAYFETGDGVKPHFTVLVGTPLPP